MNSSQNSYVPSNDDNLAGECAKFQRQDGSLLLQTQSGEGPNAVVSVMRPHQADHTSTQVHQSPFHLGSNSFVHDGSRKPTTIGSETYASRGQGLASSSFATPDFKKEKAIIGSCDEPTHSNNSSGATAEEYIRQELIHFENVLKRFYEDSAPATSQPIYHQTATDRASMPSVDDNRNQVPETQQGSHHPQSLQLKETARKSQLAHAQQVMPFMDSQDRSNPQYQQHTTQYTLGPAGQEPPSIQHPYSTGKYPEGIQNSDSPYQQQGSGFQGDMPGFANAVDLTSTYHCPNSFPFYSRSNRQGLKNFASGKFMHQNLGSSQASLLRGVLKNPSRNTQGVRDTFLTNPNMILPSSTAMQTAPLLTGRPPSANGELNSGVARSQNSSIVYRGKCPHQQQSMSVLPHGDKFQTSSNTRKVTFESSYPVSSGTSLPVASGDTHFSAHSPLSALDKAPSFTSLLEQSAINQGNLEITYTGSVPNLDLLEEHLGQWW